MMVKNFRWLPDGLQVIDKILVEIHFDYHHNHQKGLSDEFSNWRNYRPIAQALQAAGDHWMLSCGEFTSYNCCRIRPTINLF